MANGAFKFKDNSGNVVSFISGSGPNISFSGGTLDLSGMTGLTLGGLTISGSIQNAQTASSAPSYLLTSSFNTYSSSLATTGSNLFKGNQTISGSIIPAVDNAYDLGSVTHQFRDLYLSSASLYIDGTKVLGSTAQELQITTDTGQSFKILEAGSDTITLQSADGNITLTSSGGGDIIMDPTNGIIALKGTTTVYSGHKIVSSDGNSIQFGNGIAVTGSIISTVTPLVSGSSQISYTGLSNIPSGIISSSTQLPSGIVSSSLQVTGYGFSTTGSNVFVGSQVITGSLYITTDLVVQGCSSLQNITASAVSIGTNVVMLNTATPAVRFAGISVQDSGSNAGVTGSIYWDGLCNRWIYSNPSDIGYSGGMFLSGPRTATLGSESPLTCNYIAKSGGGDHLYDSCIIDDGTTVCINANLKGSGTACFGGVVCVGTNLIVQSAATFCNTVGLFGGASQLYIGATSNASDYAVLGWCSTNRSLNIQNQSTANNPQLIIACDGKVGVAVRDPIVQFHVRTNVASVNRPTTLATSATNSAAFITTIAGSSAGIAFGQLGANTSYIQATYENGSACTSLALNPYSGGVGIGTGNNAFSGQKLFIESCNDQAGITMYNSYDCNMWALATGTSGINNKGFAIRDEINGVTRLQFDNCGNVGIGTLSPVSKLEIKGTNTYNKLSTCFFGLYSSGFAFSDYNSGITYDAGANIMCLYSNYTGYGGIVLSTCGSPRVFVNVGGSVGIGTNNPSFNLDVSPGVASATIRAGSWAIMQNVTTNQAMFGRNVVYQTSIGAGWRNINTGGSTAIRMYDDPGDPSIAFHLHTSETAGTSLTSWDTSDVKMTIRNSGRVGILNIAPQGKLEVGIACSNTTAGGHFFSTFQIPVDTWSVVFYVPSNNQWNAVTEFTWTSAGDFNRSGAAYMRWAYEPGAANLGVVYTLFNNSQNATASFRRSGNEIQVYITGGAADYYVQVRIQGSKAS
jgi:hypothetical protein